MAKSLRIVMAQLNTVVGDVGGNLERVLEACAQARDELHADLVLFPELTLTGYPPEDLLLRPGLQRRVEKALAELGERLEGITAVIGHPSQVPEGLHNSASAIVDGGRACSYDKQWLPNYSVFDEKRYFIPGSAPGLFELKGVCFGITICEDLWLPGPVEQAARAGAQLILNLNASPFHLDKAAERERSARERIVDAGVPLIYCNLVGAQDELVFDGASFVMNVEGEITQHAPAFEEGLYPVDIDIVDGQAVPRAGERVSYPEEEAAAYGALVLGVRDYVNKNGFPGAVLGLSGGIDSALTLAVAVDALGPERVEAIMMPTRYTADMSLADAEEEAGILGIDYRVHPIEPMFQSFLNALAGEFAGLPVDTTEENIQARCRGLLLMAVSNKKGSIVLTTGNKSEMAVGYATLYGDMAGGFDVLKDVPKTLVFRLSEYRNSLGRVIPQRVIDRPPSAELAPDQQDSDSLPDYPVLDAILERYVEQDQCAEEIVAAGFDEAEVARVIRLVDINEYKRRQAAPGPRITRRAFGRDRRYPITSGYGRDRRWDQV